MKISLKDYRRLIIFYISFLKVIILIFVLTDKYGNEIGVSEKELANEIKESGTNPFNDISEIEEYDGLVVSTLKEFCNAFY